MTKYLRDQPFQVGGSTEAYREGWDRIFGKKCVICDGSGAVDKIDVVTGPGILEGFVQHNKVVCTVCGGSGRERPPS